MEQYRQQFENLQADLLSYDIHYSRFYRNLKPYWNFKFNNYNFNILGDHQNWKLGYELACKMIKLAGKIYEEN